MACAKPSWRPCWPNLRRRFASPPSPPSILNRHLRRARSWRDGAVPQRQRQRPQSLLRSGTNASWPLFTSSRTSSRLQNGHAAAFQHQRFNQPDIVTADAVGRAKIIMAIEQADAFVHNQRSARGQYGAAG